VDQFREFGILDVARMPSQADRLSSAPSNSTVSMKGFQEDAYRDTTIDQVPSQWPWDGPLPSAWPPGRPPGALSALGAAFGALLPVPIALLIIDCWI